MTRILMTGGTGFFGQSMVDYLARRGGEGIELTRLARHGGELIGDVRTFDVGSARFDAIIHAATPARVGIPDAEMRSIILEGTANMLKQAKRCGARRFMMVSSGGVYGGGWTQSIRETDEPRPVTAYGRAKLEAEAMATDSGLHVLLPRCFAFAGRHLPRTEHFAIGNFIRDALAGREIVIRGDGSPLRSYMHADDLCAWLLTILARGESGRPYNVGSDEAISIRELANVVRTTLNSRSVIRVLGQSVPGAANVYVPDITRARKELGLQLTYSLSQAIQASLLEGECA